MKKVIILLLPTLLLACGSGGNGEKPAPAGKSGKAAEAKLTGKATLTVTSPAFKAGARIPKKFTCDGPDISPPLYISRPPEGTRSLVIICDDPDAPSGNWVHWVMYNIPPKRLVIGQNVPKTKQPDEGIMQGTNDFKKIGYGGPCPPKGKPHRYFFRVYALDTVLDLEPGTVKKAVVKKMKGHVLGSGELMGTYRRP